MLTYNAKMNPKEYARLTIATNDLDPVYVALVNSGWDEAKVLRWCAAMVTFYHTGTACELCDLHGDDFWTEVWNRYDKNPRASERRHFRGEAGKKALKFWRNEFGTPEKFMLACMKPTFLESVNCGIPQIGTYFAWKVSDFREAVFGYDVDWSGAEKHLSAVPEKGLRFLWPDEKPYQSIWKLVDLIKDIKAPPRLTRACGIAEAETIACGVQQYYNNSIPVGKDIVDKRKALEGYGRNAAHLIRVFPVDPSDKDFL